jgi:hypothetical protein
LGVLEIDAEGEEEVNHFKDIKEGIIYYMTIHRFFTEKQRRKAIEEMERDGWTCVHIWTKRLAIRRYRCKMMKERTE